MEVFMIDFFTSSRRIAIAGSVTGSMAAACAVWGLYDGKLPSKILMTVLAVIVIVNVFIYIARIFALRKYQEILLELYEGLEMKSFLKKAEPLLDRKAGVKEAVTHAVHVANAYLALGDADAAAVLLRRQQIPEKMMELKGTVYANLGSAYLQMGDVRNAEEMIRKLKEITKNTDCAKDFRKKANYTLAYQQACLASLLGEEGKKEIVEKNYENARQSLHKLNTGIFLIKLYKSTGEIRKMEEIRKDIDFIRHQQMAES